MNSSDRSESSLHLVSEPTSPVDMPHTCLVVIPTYNEAQNIERLLAEVLSQGQAFDVLVVDDSSPDGTGDIVAALAAQNARIHLLRRAGKQGLGTAYIAGFRYGLQRGYRFLCEMDADFSHQPRYLPQMLSLAAERYDLVLGSRNIRGGHAENWSLLRHAISKGGSLYSRLVLGMPIHDCTGGYKCFRADALRALNLDDVQANGYAFQIELNYRCFLAGMRIHEMPIIFPDRVAGASKMSRSIMREAALVVLRLRFQAASAQRRKSPLHFGTSHK